MGDSEVRQFLTHLAEDLKVSASTQNQALNAVVFLYREVLSQPLGIMEPFVRAKRPKNLPVVLTKSEVLSIQTPGPYLKLAAASKATLPAPTDPLPGRLLELLAQSPQPRTLDSLRTSLQVRNQRLVEALRLLSQQSKVVRLPQGYVLHPNAPPLS